MTENALLKLRLRLLLWLKEMKRRENVSIVARQMMRDIYELNLMASSSSHGGNSFPTSPRSSSSGGSVRSCPGSVGDTAHRVYNPFAAASGTALDPWIDSKDHCR